MTMNLLDQAIEFAAVAHDGQYRKGTHIPYIMHPVAVGFALQRLGCEEPVVIAAILHDTVEDTEVELIDIETRFGTEVARLVQGVSEEDKGLTWKVRKQHTIEALSEADEGVALITIADKIHNLRCILEEFREKGERVWEKFNRGKELQEWYHRSIYEATSTLQTKAVQQLRSEYKQCIDAVFHAK